MIAKQRVNLRGAFPTSAGVVARRTSARNSTFPDWPVIGETVNPRRLAESARVGRQLRPSHGAASRSSSRTIPPRPTASRPASNCGLISAIRLTSGRAEIRGDRQDQVQRNERHIDDNEINRFGKGVGAKIPSVDAFHDDDSIVRCVFSVVKLSVADVDRVDAPSAALEQTRR